MSITLSSPAALWLLLAVPLVWIAMRYGRTNFNRGQQRTQAVIRSVLLAFLALALARPVIATGSSRLSVIYVVDVSRSVAATSIERAASRIEAIQRELAPPHSRILVFGGDTRVVPDVAALRAIASHDAAAPENAVDRSGSDIERALTEARAEIAPGHVGRLVLFSDGRETRGDASDAAVRSAVEGVPVFVEPLEPPETGDLWIDRIVAPEPLSAGALVTVTVHVGSQRATKGVIELRQGGRVLARDAAALSAGANAVPLDVVFEDPGAHVLEAVLLADGDPVEANNRLARETLVRARPRVLYVEGAIGSASYLQRALQQSGFDVEVRPPAGLPVSRAGFDPWDTVILSDVGRSAIPDAAMTALTEWVELGGGGLLVAGGEAVYGETADGGTGGYRNTPLERLTPVTFERRDEPEVALVIVLDRSWSMAGQVMELCKSAAQAAIEVLTDDQSVGLITFNDGFNWDVTLRNVGEHRAAIKKAISGIEPAGHTLIFPAVEQAYLALRDVRARAKHVVLLSDGRSYPDDYETLIKKMVDAKMTVSSIAVGPAADIELLTNLAKWGKGRSYVVEDAREVPQIFVKEAKNAATPAFDEKRLVPVLKARGFLEGVDFTGVPALRGRTATVIKDDALELVATEDGDPLLAFWPIGLGRTAVFASDVKDRWASDWIRWRGYGPFFAAIVRALERPQRPPLALEIDPGVARGETRRMSVAVEARDANGNYRNGLHPIVRVDLASGRSAEIATQQTAPGRYEATVVASAREPVAISVGGVDGALPTSRLVIPDPNAELRLRPPDEARLRAIAEATGGAWSPSADALRQSGNARSTARRAMWPGLVLAGLALWLVDILLRRIRILETDVIDNR
jgi:uncharacterized membrane protein